MNLSKDTKNFVLPSWIIKSINTSLAFSSLVIPFLLDLVLGNRGAAMIPLLKKSFKIVFSLVNERSFDVSSNEASASSNKLQFGTISS